MTISKISAYAFTLQKTDPKITFKVVGDSGAVDLDIAIRNQNRTEILVGYRRIRVAVGVSTGYVFDALTPEEIGKLYANCSTTSYEGNVAYEVRLNGVSYYATKARYSITYDFTDIPEPSASIQFADAGGLDPTLANKIIRQGVFLNGLFRIKATWGAFQPLYGATIAKQEVVIHCGSDHVIEGSTGETDVLWDMTDDMWYEVRVTDSRGYVYTTVEAFFYNKAVNYEKVKLLPRLSTDNQIKLYRVNASDVADPNGEYLHLDVRKAMTAFTAGDGRPPEFENVSYIDYRYCDVASPTFSVWTMLTSSDTYSGMLAFTQISQASAYIFEIRAYDAVGSADVIQLYVPMGQPTYHARTGGKGFAIGKYSEKDAFEVAMDSEFQNPVTFKAAAGFENGATFQNGSHESYIDESGTYDALRFYPTKGQDSDALWLGKRNTTNTGLAPYTNSGLYLGFANYRFAKVYTDSIGLGGSNPLIASDGAQDFHVDMSEANYGYRYGVTESRWSMYPRATNATDLGTPNKKWRALYATNGTIQTSDRNKKKDIEVLPDKYIDFFARLIPVSYKFIDNQSGRTHIGFIAQEVEDAMTASGITDSEFGGFCRDKDEDGKDIYSLRYDEFIAINVAVTQRQGKRIEALEERMAKLEAKVAEMGDWDLR